MRIGVIGSMQFTESLIDIRDRLQARGHDAYVTSLASPFIGKSDEEKERIKLYQKKTWTQSASFGVPCKEVMQC